MTSAGESVEGVEGEEAGLELGGGITAALPRVAFGFDFVGIIMTLAVVEQVCFFAAALEERVAKGKNQ